MGLNERLCTLGSNARMSGNSVSFSIQIPNLPCVLGSLDVILAEKEKENFISKKLYIYNLCKLIPTI